MDEIMKNMEEKEKAEKENSVSLDVVEEKLLKSSGVAVEVQPCAQDAALLKESAQKAKSSSAVDESENDTTGENVAPPTTLTRQTVGTFRPIQPGAVAVAGIGASTEHEITTVDEELTESITDSAQTSSSPDFGRDNAGEIHGEEEREGSDLPVARVVEAEVVDEREYDDMKEILNEKEAQLKELNEKLKEMETLKQEVESLRKKVSMAVPAKRASATAKAPPPTSLNRAQSDKARMSERERHALKVLLGDPSSTDLDSTLVPPDMKRHVSDSDVRLPGPSNNNGPSTSLQGTTKTPKTTVSEGNTRRLSSQISAPSSSASLGPVKQQECCIIL